MCYTPLDGRKCTSEVAGTKRQEVAKLDSHGRTLIRIRLGDFQLGP